MADGRRGRANAGRFRRVEREVSGATAPEAHRDFNEARNSSGEARGEAGHGDVLAVALGRSWGRNGSGGSYGRIERVFGAQSVAGLTAELLGCSGGLKRQRVRRIGEAQGARRRRGSRKGRGDSGHSGLYPHNGRRFADEDVHAKHSSKQLRGQLRGGARGGGSAPAAEHPPPADHCSRPHPLSLSFCEIRPKFELKTNFHQNKSCAKFCKLQIIFRCPKLILTGNRLILPDSLKIKLKPKKFQIFELGQNRISKITFDFV
jgi:hypothetical protein